MSLNIVINKVNETDYSAMEEVIERLDEEFISFFPIPNDEFCEIEGVGLSIHFKDDYGQFLNKLSEVFLELIKLDYKITELYNFETIIDIQGINKVIQLLKL